MASARPTTFSSTSFMFLKYSVRSIAGVKPGDWAAAGSAERAPNSINGVERFMRYRAFGGGGDLLHDGSSGLRVPNLPRARAVVAAGVPAVVGGDRDHQERARRPGRQKAEHGQPR